MDFKDSHFKMIFWYLVILSIVILAYDFGITFLTIPEKSVRFADGHSSSFTNILIAIVSFFTGAAVGTISKKKTDNEITNSTVTNGGPEGDSGTIPPGSGEPGTGTRLYANRGTSGGGQP